MQDRVLEVSIRKLIAAKLSLDDIYEIESSEELSLFGLDSLSRFELADAFLQKFGVDPMPEFDSPTIDQLVETVSKHLEQQKPSKQVVESRRRPSTLQAETPTPDIDLTIDDYVPNHISLVIGYDGDVSHHVVESFQAGLNAFPHFAGKIVGDSNPFQMRIESSDNRIPIQWSFSDTVTASDFETISNERWRTEFLPPYSPQAGELLCSPLLSIRVTRLKDGGSVLGLVLSHMLVDGVGLGLFFLHCAAAHREIPTPQPIHDRRVLGSATVEPTELPTWYRTDQAIDFTHEWDLAQQFNVCVFSIDDGDLAKVLPTEQTDRNSWHLLTSYLCHQLHRLNGYDTIAMWCDVRGRLSIPRTYTGNVGCYWHESITPPADGVEGLASRLRSNASAESPKVQAIYRAVKQRQERGEPVRWLGTEPNVLPVNLVPFSMEPLDLGVGKPCYVRNLTRNLHGLRISRAPQQAKFIVEACLPNDQPTSLAAECRSQGLNAQVLSLES